MTLPRSFAVGSLDAQEALEKRVDDLEYQVRLLRAWVYVTCNLLRRAGLPPVSLGALPPQEASK